MLTSFWRFVFLVCQKWRYLRYLSTKSNKTPCINNILRNNNKKSDSRDNPSSWVRFRLRIKIGPLGNKWDLALYYSCWSSTISQYIILQREKFQDNHISGLVFAPFLLPTDLLVVVAALYTMAHFNECLSSLTFYICWMLIWAIE